VGRDESCNEGIAGSNRINDGHRKSGVMEDVWQTIRSNITA
jgi:hypothetical protein